VSWANSKAGAPAGSVSPRVEPLAGKWTQRRDLGFLRPGWNEGISAAWLRIAIHVASQQDRRESGDPTTSRILPEVLKIYAVKKSVETKTPHQSLGYKPPAPDAFMPVVGARPTPHPEPVAPTALAPKPILH
jgi:hypothetical protein